MGKSSLMPTRYSHLNQDDLDEKMLGIMGVRKPTEGKKKRFTSVHTAKFAIQLKRDFVTTAQDRLTLQTQWRWKSSMSKENYSLILGKRSDRSTLRRAKHEYNQKCRGKLSRLQKTALSNI